MTRNKPVEFNEPYSTDDLFFFNKKIVLHAGARASLLPPRSGAAARELSD
jgi:hypothetical protein